MPCGCFGKKKKTVGDPIGKETPVDIKNSSSGMKDSLEPSEEKKPLIQKENDWSKHEINGDANDYRDGPDYKDDCALLGSSGPHTPSTVPAAGSEASSSGTSSPLGLRREGASSRAELAEKRREFFSDLMPPSSYHHPSTLPTAARARQGLKSRPLRPQSDPGDEEGPPPPPGPHLLRPVKMSPKNDQPEYGFESPEFLMELKAASEEISRRWATPDEGLRVRSISPSEEGNALACPEKISPEVLLLSGQVGLGKLSYSDQVQLGRVVDSPLKVMFTNTTPAEVSVAEDHSSTEVCLVNISSTKEVVPECHSYVKVDSESLLTSLMEVDPVVFSPPAEAGFVEANTSAGISFSEIAHSNVTASMEVLVDVSSSRDLVGMDFANDSTSDVDFDVGLISTSGKADVTETYMEEDVPKLNTSTSQAVPETLVTPPSPTSRLLLSVDPESDSEEEDMGSRVQELSISNQEEDSFDLTDAPIEEHHTESYNEDCNPLKGSIWEKPTEAYHEDTSRLEGSHEDDDLGDYPQRSQESLSEESLPDESQSDRELEQDRKQNGQTAEEPMILQSL